MILQNVFANTSRVSEFYAHQCWKPPCIYIEQSDIFQWGSYLKLVFYTNLTNIAKETFTLVGLYIHIQLGCMPPTTYLCKLGPMIGLSSKSR